MTELLQRGDVLPALIVLAGLLVGLVIAIVTIIAGVFKARAREETKREIAAYVAEGTIDRDTALALMQTEVKADTCCTARAFGAAKAGVAATT